MQEKELVITFELALEVLLVVFLCESFFAVTLILK